MIKTYELTYLVSQELSEEQLKSFCEKISGFVAEDGGLLERQITPFKRRLAYVIKGKIDAFLVTLFFKVNGKNLENIEKKIKAEPQILRYILFVKEPLKKINMKARRFPREKAEHASERNDSHKAELKEIDKKIEEILSQ